MRVFVAGAGGALGKQLVPQLLARGHDVVGMTRSKKGAELVRRLGARPAIADGLDPEQVGTAISEARPEAIVHQLTALEGSLDLRHFDRAFALTNRLRSEGTDHLLSAGRAAGVTRFVAQSYAGWNYERSGGAIKSEDDPLDPDPPAAFATTLAAIRHLEAAVTDPDWATGVVLRYGGFYGPGTSLSTSPDGEHVEALRKRRFPLVGSGDGVWSFIQIADAAAATVAAIESAPAGIYNVVDDEPAPVHEWLPILAEALGAKPPRRIPAWLGRIAAGEAAAIMMGSVRGASNEKAKRVLNWQPRYRSWRQGFVDGLE
jgi:nucleoside-diphosphate-sugar epimerase